MSDLRAGADVPVRSVGEDLDRWLRPAVRDLQAYAVPDADGLVKLDAMENPYPWPPAMRAEWLDLLRTVTVNRYPDPRARNLRRRLREYMDIPEELGLLLGNGSDELIQLLQLAVGGSGRTVLAPEPSFVMYRLIAAATGSQYVGIPLNGDFDLDAEAMISAVQNHQPAVVFIAYPNNPTANLFDRDALEALIAQAPGLVVMDEAYHPFANRSFLRHPATQRNLLVMRTISKLGLAGLRLGLLAGARPWIGELEKLRLPYNINTLTQISAEFALSNEAVFSEQVAKICAERERVSVRLAELPGVTVYPSATNFLLFRCRNADRIFAGLLERGVLLKNLHRPDTPLSGCLRVTVGSQEENDFFLGALTGVLNS